MIDYKINDINSIDEGGIFLKEDINNRQIRWYNLKDIVFIEDYIFYPEIYLYSYKNNKVYNPLQEKIMSLSNIKSADKIKYTVQDIKEYSICEDEVFFFVYNTDNYYHFLYDSLPYLITYLELKKYKKLKLLVNYPNIESKQIYNFVKEFLSILGIYEKDIIFLQKNTLYKNMTVSDSYTHGFNSNIPPRKEIYELYSKISNLSYIENLNSPKKIYVSRRSWKHGDYSNIGTNYTTRRRMTNEDELVEYLKSIGYEEIFTELLDSKTKISLFKNATHVVGAIGGGMANVLFSNPECKVVVLCSPGFLNVNYRFKYSLCNTNVYYYNKTEHSENGDFLKYMRVKCGKIIGEIVEIDGDVITIAYTDKKVAGWNSSISYDYFRTNKENCEKLDSGLNSNWNIDIEEFKKINYL